MSAQTNTHTPSALIGQSPCRSHLFIDSKTVKSDTLAFVPPCVRIVPGPALRRRCVKAALYSRELTENGSPAGGMDSPLHLSLSLYIYIKIYQVTDPTALSVCDIAAEPLSMHCARTKLYL